MRWASYKALYIRKAFLAVVVSALRYGPLPQDTLLRILSK